MSTIPHKFLPSFVTHFQRLISAVKNDDESSFVIPAFNSTLYPCWGSILKQTFIDTHMAMLLPVLKLRNGDDAGGLHGFLQLGASEDRLNGLDVVRRGG